MTSTLSRHMRWLFCFSGIHTHTESNCIKLQRPRDVWNPQTIGPHGYRSKFVMWICGTGKSCVWEMSWYLCNQFPKHSVTLTDHISLHQDMSHIIIQSHSFSHVPKSALKTSLRCDGADQTWETRRYDRAPALCSGSGSFVVKSLFELWDLTIQELWFHPLFPAIGHKVTLQCSWGNNVQFSFSSVCFSSTIKNNL